MLTSTSSAVSRRPTPPAQAPARALSAQVVDLAARRAAPRAAVPTAPPALLITPELLDALGGPWAALRSQLSP